MSTHARRALGSEPRGGHGTGGRAGGQADRPRRANDVVARCFRAICEAGRRERGAGTEGGSRLEERRFYHQKRSECVEISSALPPSSLSTIHLFKLPTRASSPTSLSLSLPLLPFLSYPRSLTRSRDERDDRATLQDGAAAAADAGKMGGIEGVHTSAEKGNYHGMMGTIYYTVPSLTS